MHTPATESTVVTFRSVICVVYKKEGEVTAELIAVGTPMQTNQYIFTLLETRRLHAKKWKITWFWIENFIA